MAKATFFPQLTFSPRYLLATRPRLVMAVGLGALTMVVVLGGLLPQFNALWEVWGRQNQERAQLTKLQKKVSQLEEVGITAPATQVELVNQALPSRKPLLELLANVNGVVAETQVVITNVELSPGVIASEGAEAQIPLTVRGKAGEYDRIEIAMTAEGSLTQINQFIESVEKITPATTVTKISLNKLNRTRAGSTDVQFEAQITLTSYYFTKSIAATLDAPLPKVETGEQAILDKIKGFTQNVYQRQKTIQGGGGDDLFGIKGVVDTTPQ